MAKLLRFTKNYRKEVLLGPFFKFLEAVFELLLPIYMSYLIDNGVAKNDSHYIFKTALIMIAMSIIGLICVMICQYYSSVASQGFGTELRSALLEKINTFSHKELDNFGTSTLITRMTNDINQLQLALAMLIRLVFRAPFLSIGSLVMAFYISPKLAAIFLTALILFCLVLFIMMTRTVPLYKKVQAKVDNLNTILVENLSGVRVLRAFGQKKYSQQKMADTTDDLARAYNRVANISALLNPATLLVMNGATIALLYLGGVSINSGSLTQGELLALINYLMQMLLALIVVSNLVIIFTKAAASAERVNDILETESSITDTHTDQTDIPPLTDTDYVLTFEEVSFRYTATSGLALDALDFSLHPGESLGIVGPTGSGKSTLTQLIPRFYDPTVGTVTLFGHALTDLPLTTLRETIGIVPQKSVLFTGTIRDNLKWGKQGATDEDCWQALETAQCLDFVSTLPDKLDTMVTESGKNFSGGQRQRLAIARAVIRKPLILILDDSLSALDYQTDLELRQALKRDLDQTTLIIVSQRISSVQHAEKIVVLDDGKQVASGTHEVLINESETYQAIYASQQEKEDEN
ncbi:ABC transporter ATP-binding protein/permease [Vagococcus sp. PNs007]|uniref:ABC transporter ATP-binding protein/permease n=1 Tax=Vagococcus proximus TaxID=2991417 RepID=A0ABT5X434_9ENTE|nr:ABC transporter ATP-binding protein [Vagococcus proximus]MDF0480757.1 ABC transporter ATP-binding protein/permease [Vagococcus proximus]